MQYTSRSLRRRRNTDKWEVALSHKDPNTSDSVTTYHTLTAKTEAQARKKRDALILELERKGSAYSSEKTVSEFLDEFINWKDATNSVEKSTIYHYHRDARVINRFIGDLPLRDLTTAAVHQLIADMVADGLMPRSIAKPYRLLRQATRCAVADGVLGRNPCEGVKPPKIERKAVTTLPKAERIRMIQLVSKPPRTPIKLAIHIALATGMRRGEICGLRWSDLDDATQSISVNRAIGIMEGGRYVKEPKTKASYRTIPLTPELYSILSAIREQTRRDLAGLRVEMGDPYILGTQEPESRFYQPDHLSRDYSVFCEAHGFTIGFHDLRHTFATMLISSGVDIRTVASLLGHSSVAHTLNMYAEADPEAKRAARATIQEALGGGAESVPATTSETVGIPEESEIADRTAYESANNPGESKSEEDALASLAGIFTVDQLKMILEFASKQHGSAPA